MELPSKWKSLEPFRVGVLCQGQEMAKQIEKYYIERVNEYNLENKDKYGFIPIEIHTFQCIERHLTNNTDAYWSTFTPSKAGKGSGVEFIRKRLGLNENDIICMGDSGNDISMLGIHGYNSVVMANASQALIEFYEENNNENNKLIKTKQSKTLGVIEGLQFYGPGLLKK